MIQFTISDDATTTDSPCLFAFFWSSSVWAPANDSLADIFDIIS